MIIQNAKIRYVVPQGTLAVVIYEQPDGVRDTTFVESRYAGTPAALVGQDVDLAITGYGTLALVAPAGESTPEELEAAIEGV